MVKYERNVSDNREYLLDIEVCCYSFGPGKEMRSGRIHEDFSSYCS